MAHDEVAVTRLVADEVDHPDGLLDRVRVRVDEDGAVAEAFGRGNVDVGHLQAVKLALLLLHLSPLAVEPVRRMDLSEGFHGQEEDQLEMGHQPGQRAALEGGDKAFTRLHSRFLY